MIRTPLALLTLFSAASACSPSLPGPPATDPAHAELPSQFRNKCDAAKGQLRPLIVEWSAPDRATFQKIVARCSASNSPRCAPRARAIPNAAPARCSSITNASPWKSHPRLRRRIKPSSTRKTASAGATAVMHTSNRAPCRSPEPPAPKRSTPNPEARIRGMILYNLALIDEATPDSKAACEWLRQSASVRPGVGAVQAKFDALKCRDLLAR